MTLHKITYQSTSTLLRSILLSCTIIAGIGLGLWPSYSSPSPMMTAKQQAFIQNMRIQMTMTFKDALAIVLKYEGGYVNNPNDKGGETNYGVTVNVARRFGYTGSMKTIPIDVVTQIYKTLYWDAIHGDDLPFMVAFALFDAAVNSGTARASKFLQEALGVTVDGNFGPKTLEAAKAHPDSFLLAQEVNARRLQFLKGLGSQWKIFGLGWASRMADNFTLVNSFRKSMLYS